MSIINCGVWFVIVRFVKVGIVNGVKLFMVVIFSGVVYGVLVYIGNVCIYKGVDECWFVYCKGICVLVVSKGGCRMLGVF